MGQVSTGITISFATGFFAEILDVTPPAGSREALKTSHQGTTIAHTFTPGKLVDWGDCVIEMQYDPGEDPPIDDAAESCVITFADGSTSTFSAFMTGFEPGAVLEEVMTASATLKVSGNVVTVDGS